MRRGAEISDDIEPIFDPFEPLAEENLQDKLAGIDAPGRDGGSTDDGEEKNACGDIGPGNDGCVYEVTIWYITPDLITTVVGPGGTCKDAGPCKSGSVGGRPCTSAQWSFCHSFGTLWAAQAFAQAKQNEADQLWQNCGYDSGVTAVLQAGPITGIPSDGPFGDCQETPASPDDPGADAGETMKPKCNSGDCDNAPSV